MLTPFDWHALFQCLRPLSEGFSFSFFFFLKLFSMKKKTFCNSVFAYVLIFLNLFAVYVQTYVLKLMNSSGVTESGESEKVLLLMESGVRLHTTAYLR